MGNPGPFYISANGAIEISARRPVRTLSARNTGDCVVQVGSRFHFFEVNRALEFDRAAAFEMRLVPPVGGPAPSDSSEAE